MATAVEFHTGVAEPIGFACRLLRKAYRKGARVLVTAPAPMLARLDHDLWTFDERDFVPHARWSPALSAALAARTPIWLVDTSPPAGSPPVLVNLGAGLVDDLSPFTRVIEIVASDDDQVQAARRRWRAYKDLGLPLVQHAAGAGGG